MVQNLDAQATWRMGFMGPFLKNYFSEIDSFKEKKGVGSVLFLFTLQDIRADEIRVKISPVFECRGFTSQMWTVCVSTRQSDVGHYRKCP